MTRLPVFKTDLHAKAHMLNVVVPTARTLAKFGLTDVEWLLLLSGQSWLCPVCGGNKRRWNTDHEHVPGWAKMPPERRKAYVRGVLCWHCNKFSVPSNMNSRQAQRVVAYLEAYEERRNRVLEQLEA